MDFNVVTEKFVSVMPNTGFLYLPVPVTDKNPHSALCARGVLYSSAIKDG